MKYVVLRTGGKQYKVAEGDILRVNKIAPVSTGKDVEDAKDYSFNDVLFYANDGFYEIGRPRIKGVMVKGTILREMKGEKIRVSKFKSKVRYRRVYGHRDLLTEIKIEKILAKGETDKAKIKSAKG